MCDVGDMLFLIFLLRSESYMFAVASVDVLDGSHIEPMTMFTAPYAEIYDFKALLCDGEPSLVVLCSDSNGKSYLIINNLNIANDSEKPWRVVAGPRSRFPDSLIDEKNPREAGNTIRCFIFNPDNYSFDVVSRAVQLECGGFDGNFDQNDWVALYKHVDQYLHSPAFDERQNARLARISTAATPMEPMTIEIFWRNLLSSCDQLMESGCLPISIWHSQHLGLFGVIQENRFTVRMPQDRFMKNILTPTKTDLKDNLHSDLIGHLATCFEAVMRRQSRENVEKAANFISGPYARVHTMFEDIIRRFCKAPETDHALESSIVEIAYGGSFCAGLLASTIQRLVDDRFYFGLSLLAITTASELSSEIVLDSWRASVAIYHEALLNVTKQYRLMSQMLSLRLSESDYESTVIFAFLSQGGLSAVEGYARAQAFLEPEMEADEDVELDLPVESQVVDRNAPFVNFSERVIEAAIDLLGPQNPHLFLPRFLLTTGHFSTLSEYCQLNKPYPQKFHFAFCYFEGNVYCGLGLPYEAVRAFGSALHGIEAEDDILNSVVLEEQVPQRKISVAEYFLKVIGLLESYDYKEQLVFVGRLALSKIEAGNAFLPEIYTALFKHELNSDLYCESLQTLSANPASDCRKKCLREFLARLVERNEIKILIDSDYGQMTDQVVEILEARARTADISEDITLYELLYDFHLKRCELSKASTIMYELSWRLRSGVQTQETLRKRCCALSSVCSTLALLPIDLQWFAFQSDAREKQKGSDELVEICIDDDDVSVGSGRLPEFDDYYRKDNGKNLAIVTLGDIRKESVLATCRSVLLDTVSANELTDSSRVSFIPPLQPYDVLNLLVGRKLFSHSWTLARTFDLPPFSILEAVVTDCINFDASGSNLLPPWVAVCRKFVTGIFMGKDRHWYVVKSMLKIAMKDRPNDPEILRCVTTVFVINHWPIPFWLSELYKKQNVADFLHLLVSYGCLSNACEILIDLVDSTTRSITSNKASTILPYNVIDHLLLLSKKADDGAISSSVNELKKKLNIYFETLESFSR
ncbi:hypothetical protein AB6A40_002013 [Gnathostoma spinigerum]|uniref:Uncharacterized protein n=1 Tax=Gnathostoma spinigerum TaxID=75299 RepID=A0ABD6ED95_9BILA